jgi:hypothetical protein
MALLAVLAVVALVSLLTVATMSLSTRLNQSSILSYRDAQLGVAASYSVGEALSRWRELHLGLTPAGSTRSLPVLIPNLPFAASATVTRLDPSGFWIVGEAAAADSSRRRENLIVRLDLPSLDSIPMAMAAGDVVLSEDFEILRDTSSDCPSAAPDLTITPTAVLSSAIGQLPPLVVDRSAAAGDSSAMLHIGGLAVEDLVSAPDVTLDPGTITETPNGVVHATGDLVLTGGSGGGTLVVEGKLTVAGPVKFSGVLVVRGGVEMTAGGAELTGMIRFPPGTGGMAATIHLDRSLVFQPRACAAAAALAGGLLPRPVRGRRWAELY